jgi:hypothetical protein
VVVPLARENEGGVRLAPGGTRLEIKAPETGNFEAWLERLPELVSDLDTSRLKRIETDEI